MQAGSTSLKSSRSGAPEALVALARLLARQAAREFALNTQVQSDQSPPAPGIGDD
jgi:hypothetical protein